MPCGQYNGHFLPRHSPDFRTGLRLSFRAPEVPFRTKHPKIICYLVFDGFPLANALYVLVLCAPSPRPSGKLAANLGKCQ